MRERPAQVLVLGSDSPMRKRVSAILADQFDVQMTPNGRDALETLDRAQPPVDLIILILDRLPPEHLRLLLSGLRELPHGPPVLVVAGGGADTAARALGAQAGIDEPFSPSTLATHVRRLLRSR